MAPVGTALAAAALLMAVSSGVSAGRADFVQRVIQSGQQQMRRVREPPEDQFAASASRGGARVRTQRRLPPSLWEALNMAMSHEAFNRSRLLGRRHRPRSRPSPPPQVTARQRPAEVKSPRQQKMQPLLQSAMYSAQSAPDGAGHRSPWPASEDSGQPHWPDVQSGYEAHHPGDHTAHWPGAGRDHSADWPDAGRDHSADWPDAESDYDHSPHWSGGGHRSHHSGASRRTRQGPHLNITETLTGCGCWGVPAVPERTAVLLLPPLPAPEASRLDLHLPLRAPPPAGRRPLVTRLELCAADGSRPRLAASLHLKSAPHRPRWRHAIVSDWLAMLLRRGVGGQQGEAQSRCVRLLLPAAESVSLDRRGRRRVHLTARPLLHRDT